MATKVRVQYSANDWELYTESMPCKSAAGGLNAAATKALNCGDPAEARRIFQEAQEKFAKYGAADSEPRWRFADLFEKQFGEDY